MITTVPKYTQFLHTECLFQKFIYFFFNTIIIPDIFLLISITVKPTCIRRPTLGATQIQFLFVVIFYFYSYAASPGRSVITIIWSFTIDFGCWWLIFSIHFCLSGVHSSLCMLSILLDCLSDCQFLFELFLKSSRLKWLFRMLALPFVIIICNSSRCSINSNFFSWLYVLSGIVPIFPITMDTSLESVFCILQPSLPPVVVGTPLRFHMDRLLLLWCSDCFQLLFSTRSFVHLLSFSNYYLESLSFSTFLHLVDQFCLLLLALLDLNLISFSWWLSLY